MILELHAQSTNYEPVSIFVLPPPPPTSSRQGETFCAPPLLFFRGDKFLHPPSVLLKLQAPVFETTSKLFVSPLNPCMEMVVLCM